ncbi:unnamed protein product [Alternaria alternata]
MKFKNNEVLRSGWRKKKHDLGLSTSDIRTYTGLKDAYLHSNKDSSTSAPCRPTARQFILKSREAKSQDTFSDKSGYSGDLSGLM